MESREHARAHSARLSSRSLTDAATTTVEIRESDPNADFRARAQRERAPEGTPLYVHLPFCAAKCHYCDFFSVPVAGQDRASNLDAILREAELYAPHRPRMVFVGGGTPSLLSSDELKRLFDRLHAITSFRDAALEVTAECNPESLDRDKARALLDLGVTRLSIGFQSLHDEVLQLFGRVHSVGQSFEAYDAARAAGATDVNIDMIYAVPGQTADAWERDLARVLDLGPEHLSAYNLTFEEETVFRRWLDQGRLTKSHEDVELALFDATRRLNLMRGLEAYEISNFARSGRECRHNVNYWRNGPYLGIGPSAVSKIGYTRGGNIKSVGAYNRQIQSQGHARTWEETPSPAERLAETWWLGLRLAEGLTAAEARARAGFEATSDPTIEIVENLIEDDLVDARNGRLRLTARGLPLADYVAKRFLTATSDVRIG